MDRPNGPQKRTVGYAVQTPRPQSNFWKHPPPAIAAGTDRAWDAVWDAFVDPLTVGRFSSKPYSPSWSQEPRLFLAPSDLNPYFPSLWRIWGIGVSWTCWWGQNSIGYSLGLLCAQRPQLLWAIIAFFPPKETAYHDVQACPLYLHNAPWGLDHS